MQTTDHDALLELLFDRIVAADLPDPIADLLLAAYEGDQALAALGHGEQPARPTASPETTVAAEPPGMFVRAIQVEGFRGISRAATLDLQPGPGLTLVAGRNGSGKSSFAEAAEFVLTGDNKRWSSRQGKIWRDGWRNLHHARGTSRIAVDLVLAKDPGTTRVARRWAPEDDLDDGKWTVQRPGQKEQPFVDLRWTEPLEVYRPFLSYSELGGLIDGEPSKLHDALHDLLGLERLAAAEKRLIDLRRQLDAIVAAPRATLRELKPDLLASDDPRARQAASLLDAKNPDLEALTSLATGDSAPPGELAGLRALVGLEAPSAEAVEEAAERLVQARQQVETLSSDHAATADRVAGLLDAALEHHDAAGDGPCPVCGTGFLDAGWRQRAGAQVDELRAVARDLATARREHEGARAAIRGLGRPLPNVLAAPPAGIDTTAAHQAWHRWLEVMNRDSTDELLPAAQELGRRVGAARAAAETELQQRDDAWKPLAVRLAQWCEQARRAAETVQRAKEVKAAVSWFKDTRDELRNDRLTPFEAESQWVWQELRQQSNVQLGSIRLSGTSNRRHVALNVSVDGTGSSALAVMSQGELHSLGLALFLPRATTTESPFRFVIIDDPVQAMDPAKVDGLARVLAKVAEHRQVVVFTHDDRLAEAVRRLQLPARVVEVVRGERSIVELRITDDPVRRYLDDARALASTPELPAQIRSELVAGYCRSALEAACHAAVRMRRLGRGERHEDVERTLERGHKLHQLVTLALFDDVDRGGDTMPHLDRRDRRAATALRAVKEGVHQGYSGELHGLISDTERLVAAVS